jgi:X-Pro dipeptidyl-peptidase
VLEAVVASTGTERLVRRRIPTLGVALAALTAVLTTGSAAYAAQPRTVAHIRGQQTVPAYSYADAIRESVWVPSTLDNDRDGKPDRIAVDLIRPREAATAGVKVPVIMDASPYYQCCGRGNESETKRYAADGTVTKFPLFYDNYFVPRGYAFAAVDLVGTSRSTGCEDVGGRAEVLGTKAVIDWLGGRVPGFHADGSPAVADWTTGKVGMIGKSWDGTIANGVAATGVPNLATIVPISAIASWYDYERADGVLPVAHHSRSLHNTVSGRPAGVCTAAINDLETGSDDATGNYNAFWAARDFTAQAANVHASVFQYHGLNDQNVRTRHLARWQAALAARSVPRKLWLSLAGHVDPFDIRRSDWVPTLHRWFDFWLQGLQNGIMTEPAVSIERTPGHWVDEPSWPAGTATTLPLGPGNGTTGSIGLPATSAAVSRTVQDNPSATEAQAVATPNQGLSWRQVFLTPTLTQPIRVSGSPTVTVRLQANRPTTEVTARLVDYGRADRLNYRASGEGITTLSTESCWGDSTAADDACYRDTREVVATTDLDVFSRGWVDAAHRNSLTSPQPLSPGVWYTVTLRLQAQDTVLAAGHVLGLVITLSDTRATSPRTTGATVTLDLSSGRISLPVVGTGAVLPRTGAVPHVTTPPANRTGLVEQLSGPEDLLTRFR